MKKAFALLFVLALMFNATAGMAEELDLRNGLDLSVAVTLPEGAHVAKYTADNQFSRSEIAYNEEGKPSIMLTVAADELYVGQNLADLSEEDRNLIISEITVEMVSPEVELRTTQSGYQYIVANETTADNDTCDTIMLLNGYFIMVQVFYEDYSELTAEDVEIGPSIVETLRFISGSDS